MALPYPRVPGVEHRMVQAGDVRLHVAEAGEGDPVVLLHGWPQHWYEWRHQIPALAERYRVICPDLRGLGWSEAPPGDYRKETLAGDIAALLDALGVRDVRLAGHDWGGFVGFLLCLRRPDLVRRFLALNIIHPWPKPGARNLTDPRWPLHIPVLSAPGLGRWLVRNQAGFVAGFIRRASRHPEAFSDGELAAFAEPLREPGRAEASVAIYRTFLLREVLPLLRGAYRGERLTTPTLLLFGAGDPAISPRTLRGFEEHADDMRLEIVEDSGHFIVEERPDLVLDRMLGFFAEGAEQPGPAKPAGRSRRRPQTASGTRSRAS